jgi:hypothetical protein
MGITISAGHAVSRCKSPARGALGCLQTHRHSEMDKTMNADAREATSPDSQEQKLCRCGRICVFCPAYAGSDETWPGVDSEREFLEGAVSLFQNIVILEVWSKSQWSGLGPRVTGTTRGYLRPGSAQSSSRSARLNAMQCDAVCGATLGMSSEDHEVEMMIHQSLIAANYTACCEAARRSSREWQGQGVKPVAVVAVKLTGSWESRIYDRRAGEADEGFGVGCDWR